MEQQQPEDVAAYNERSLNTLSRAIALSAEQFAIILVRCNYRHLQTEMLQRLRERCPVSVPEIHLPPLSTTLFGKMIEEFGELPSLPGVMVLGLESAVAIDATSSNPSWSRSFCSTSPRALINFAIKSGRWACR
jgi:hypothetical protein